jgi:programmed cell death protein 5
MSSEDEIKKRMLAKRMQEQQMMQYQSAQEQINQQAAMEEQMQVIKSIMSQILEPNARDRINNLRTVKPEIAMQLEMYLAQLAQSGQIKSKITDEQIVVILKKITERKDTKIVRK